MVLYCTSRFYRLLQVARLLFFTFLVLQVVTGLYRLLHVTYGYYRLIKVFTGYYSVSQCGYAAAPESPHLRPRRAGHRSRHEEPWEVSFSSSPPREDGQGSLTFSPRKEAS